MANHATTAPEAGASSKSKTARAISPLALAYPVPVAAALLGLGVSKTWAAVREGKIRVTRFGRRTVVARSEIERLVVEGF